MVPILRHEDFFKQRPSKNFWKKAKLHFYVQPHMKKISQGKARLDFKAQGDMQVDRFLPYFFFILFHK